MTLAKFIIPNLLLLGVGGQVFPYLVLERLRNRTIASRPDRGGKALLWLLSFHISVRAPGWATGKGSLSSAGKIVKNVKTSQCTEKNIYYNISGCVWVCFVIYITYIITIYCNIFCNIYYRTHLDTFYFIPPPPAFPSPYSLFFKRGRCSRHGPPLKGILDEVS